MSDIAPTRRKRGGQPGNLNAAKHLFYSQQFKAGELADLDSMIAKDLQSEIAMLRVVTRRVMELAGLLKAQKLICGENGNEDLAKAISDALSEVVQEMKLA